MWSFHATRSVPKNSTPKVIRPKASPGMTIRGRGGWAPPEEVTEGEWAGVVSTEEPALAPVMPSVTTRGAASAFIGINLEGLGCVAEDTCPRR